VSAFGCDRSFHEENDNDERDSNDSKKKECVEIRKGRCLLFAEVGQALQGHLFRRNRVADLLKKNWLGLIEVGIYLWIQWTQEYLAILLELYRPLAWKLTRRSVL
jgi:hypothetical protein